MEGVTEVMHDLLCRLVILETISNLVCRDTTVLDVTSSHHVTCHIHLMTVDKTQPFT